MRILMTFLETRNPCDIPWPFFSRELCRKGHIVGANLKGEVRISIENPEKIAENKAISDGNRRYFGIHDRVSVVNRRQCRRFPAKKGPGNLTPNLFARFLRKRLHIERFSPRDSRVGSSPRL